MSHIVGIFLVWHMIMYNVLRGEQPAEVCLKREDEPERVFSVKYCYFYHVSHLGLKEL